MSCDYYAFINRKLFWLSTHILGLYPPPLFAKVKGGGGYNPGITKFENFPYQNFPEVKKQGGGIIQGGYNPRIWVDVPPPHTPKKIGKSAGLTSGSDAAGSVNN